MALAVAEKEMGAEPEPAEALGIESHEELLEAVQGQPAGAVSLTEDVPPLAGRFKLEVASR
jgi:hypothetical protein